MPLGLMFKYANGAAKKIRKLVQIQLSDFAHPVAHIIE